MEVCPYEELFEKIKLSQVKDVVLMGASKYKMFDASSKIGYDKITLTSGELKDAVKIASILAKDGDNVLLSPACASFDFFSGYAERGETFIKIVEEL